MSTLIVTEKDFVVHEQSRGWQTPHIFRTQQQYAAWQQANPDRRMVRRSAGRGRLAKAIDHRRELPDLPDVDTTPIDLLNVIGRARHAAADFAGWRKDTATAGAAFAHESQALRFLQEMTQIGCVARRQPIAPTQRRWAKCSLIVVELGMSQKVGSLV